MGAFYAFIAFLFWGLSPIFWKMIDHIPADEILAHRVFWSFIFLTLFLSLQRRWKEVKSVFAQPKQALLMTISAALISSNWFTYIYAVNSGNILEASLGYYMNPLINVLLGIVFLGERQNFIQTLCLILATVGVGILVGAFGEIPYLAIILACTFGFYALVRKHTPVQSIPGLFIEVLYVAPFVMGYLVYLAVSTDQVIVKPTLFENGMLMGAGLVTILPLVWFASAVKRLSLTVTGLFQYIAPTGQFLLAVFMFGETFTRVHALTFSCIWIALAIYTADNFRRRKAQG